VSVSGWCPVETVCLPLSYGGNPGANGVSYRCANGTRLGQGTTYLALGSKNVLLVASLASASATATDLAEYRERRFTYAAEMAAVFAQVSPGYCLIQNARGHQMLTFVPHCMYELRTLGTSADFGQKHGKLAPWN
jgi:hypothetical protein